MSVETNGLCDYGFYHSESPQCKNNALFILARVAHGESDVEVVYFCKDHKIQFENNDPCDYIFTIRELPKINPN